MATSEEADGARAHARAGAVVPVDRGDLQEVGGERRSLHQARRRSLWLTKRHTKRGARPSMLVSGSSLEAKLALLAKEEEEEIEHGD